MSHIRSGRSPSEKGQIAIVYSEHSDSDQKTDSETRARARQTYALQREAMRQRAEALGFSIELFDIKQQRLSLSRFDSILEARGITGLVLAPPNSLHLDPTLLHLSRYAMVTTSYSWPDVPIDRITPNHRNNLQTVYQKLLHCGYQRIGLCLPGNLRSSSNANWKLGYLFEEDQRPARFHIPVFIGKPGETPITEFQQWLRRWKPDSLITVIGHEKKWLNELGIIDPDELALTCLNWLPGSPCPGVTEMHDVVGKTIIDVVAAQITRNEFGFPEHPKQIFIDGVWTDGETPLPQRRPKRSSVRRSS